MKKVFVIKIMGHFESLEIELVAETEQEARILAAHSCRCSVKSITCIKCINENYNEDYYFKTIKLL